MIYAKVAALGTIVVLTLILAFLVKGKYSWILIMLNFICAGMLSFYIFYYIGSYSSSDGETVLWTDLKKVSEGRYNLFIDVRWSKKPDIFGFDGEDDALVIRFNPAKLKIASPDRTYDSGTIGRCLLMLPEDFEYSSIDKGEAEIMFDVKDGENYTANLIVKDAGPGTDIKVYFIHDYKIPLETNTYWEKGQTIIIDK